LIITGNDNVDRAVPLPTLNKYENRTVLMLDNREQRRALAQIMNGSNGPTNVRITLKDDSGNILDSSVLTLQPYTAVSGYLDEVYPGDIVADRSVYLDIQATGFGVATVGCETGDGFATIIQALKNPLW
jgi:hypothetical protein